MTHSQSGPQAMQDDSTSSLVGHCAKTPTPSHRGVQRESTEVEDSVAHSELQKNITLHERSYCRATTIVSTPRKGPADGVSGLVPTLQQVVSSDEPETCGSQKLTGFGRNVVATVNLECRLDLKTIALHARNAEYNPKVRTPV